ncbi:hypothetical protein LSUB1_G007518 [Lachnellula subtilissima]|uniref:Uncharacterized protein n=1 Tax=Lachnellula subtilissima TaxID=602034 RepID=A0A8H8RCZ1_9HELO|nr:hypothetical protein LSUB1_G007518 [Lachnellula subtilissima]
MPKRMAEMNRGTKEPLLQVKAPDNLPEDHKPTERWTAVRLPKDPTGKVLDRLEDLELGEEVGMHVAPTKAELDEHGMDAGNTALEGDEDGMLEVTGQEGRKKGMSRDSGD